MQRAIPLILIAIGLIVAISMGALRSHRVWPDPIEQLRQTYVKKPIPSADHTKLTPLQKDFATPQEVTEACLSCHTESGKEVMASSHWNWVREEYIPGRGIRSIGKKDILNNYCIGVSGNLDACGRCHAGYGFLGSDFDFSEPRNIDCLVCHDNSGTYTKAGGAMPDSSVDLKDVAQHVGRPQRANCGYCHFFGGGGNNVKHGDLEEALFTPDRDLDVHMASTESDLQCVDCHTTRNHRMLGKLYSVSSMNRNRSSCEQCHGALPHEDGILNEHTLKVACQTCHIPRYAKANATKLTWDWSTAGNLRDGAPYESKDSAGYTTYASIKGSFTWGRNVQPEYAWFNGTAGHYLLGDTTSASSAIPINTFYGSYDDPDAKIIPVKIHRAKQLYDPVTKMLVQPKLYAPEKGQGAYWKDFVWSWAAVEGMKTVGLPFSGQYEFAATEMTWPINHMVAPKEDAVSCAECHTRQDSRLANLGGFYMPGRDRGAAVELFGKLALSGVLLAIAAHGVGRAVVARRKKTVWHDH
jgi:octaheme c-type cytochrome (tetrathionate reductase family)